ncbi:Uncharacterized protein APZ42_029591 [Daphnia magna]|uniref:Uncharacterized protein n=1 Tax=Daphnia magna TaxID=35525 RepID=A0A164PPC9_9CRUS|nr:Uncharacterized protein APZ42_029591 [Daphnia magna]
MLPFFFLLKKLWFHKNVTIKEEKTKFKIRVQGWQRDWWRIEQHPPLTFPNGSNICNILRF